MVECARCGKIIPAGAPWELGHDDNNRDAAPAMPEHQASNRAVASHGR
jgi:hypothetical protein